MWIELHQGARQHPKIIKLARRLNVPHVQALGHICSLWLWTLDLAPDGDLGSFAVDDIEIGAMWEGEEGALVGAAILVGLIDQAEFGLVIHDWEDFSGSLKSAKRARAYRSRKRHAAVTQNHAPSRDGHVESRDITQNDRTTERPERPERTKDQSNDGHVSSPPSVKPVPLTDAAGSRGAEVERVKAHYLERFPGRHAQAAAAEPKVLAQLRGKFTADDLCRAIDGCHGDNWHQERGKTDLRLILRDEDHVGSFMAMTERRPEKPKGIVAESKAWAEKMQAQLDAEEQQSRDGVVDAEDFL